ncbi:MAG: CRISPR-associated endonuclease Cas2 [Defluviicoccus sp.]
MTSQSTRHGRPPKRENGTSRNEHLVLVTYDIAHPRRWRRVFKLLHGYGEWLQLSVFQCRLSVRRQRDLAEELGRLIKADEDHVLIVDTEASNGAREAVVSLGRPYEPVQRQTNIF